METKNIHILPAELDSLEQSLNDVPIELSGSNDLQIMAIFDSVGTIVLEPTTGHIRRVRIKDKIDEFHVLEKTDKYFYFDYNNKRFFIKYVNQNV